MAKIPNPIDKHVGIRVRMRRMMLEMSQEKLADALGVTFQQVQKYEKGTNRIGASRLQQIANFLGVPAAFFFEGANEMQANPLAAGFSDSAEDTYISELLSTSDGLSLTKAFVRIKDNKMRRRLVELVEAIAENEGSGNKVA